MLNKQHIISIKDKKVNKESKPFIIAEMSGNHNQSLDRALKIVDSAAKAGVSALKLQTYTADTMTLDISEGDFYIDDKNSPWKGHSLYELYQQAYTPWQWHKPIFDRCEELGIIGFSTPFDATAVDFLESLNVPCYKIASFENVDIPLLKKVAKTGKPVFMSTGMATLSDLKEAVKALRENGTKDLVLLKCTSTYPANPKNSNILTIPDLKEIFNCEVGLSDHTLGIGVAIASIALGATVIEKHFTLCRADGGVDAAFSMEPEEMKTLVIEAEKARQSLGEVYYGTTEGEKDSLKFRRSLYVAEDMKAGEIFTESNIRSIRPGYGLAPKHYESILHKRVTRDVKKGTPLSWDMILKTGDRK